MSCSILFGISPEYHPDVTSSNQERHGHNRERDAEYSDHLIPLGLCAGSCSPARERMQAHAEGADQQKDRHCDASADRHGPLDGFVPTVSGLPILHAPVGYHDAYSTGNGRPGNSKDMRRYREAESTPIASRMIPARAKAAAHIRSRVAPAPSADAALYAPAMARHEPKNERPARAMQTMASQIMGEAYPIPLGLSHGHTSGLFEE